MKKKIFRTLLVTACSTGLWMGCNTTSTTSGEDDMYNNRDTADNTGNDPDRSMDNEIMEKNDTADMKPDSLR